MWPCVITNNNWYFYDYDHNDLVYYSCVYNWEWSQCWNYWFVPYSAWTEFYCENKPTYYGFSDFTYDWEYNLSFPSWSTWFRSSNLKSSKVYVTSEQTSSMWTSLVNAWSWLLHIWIQLLPYAIAFTIILLIFWLIKNWSKLKTNKWLWDSSIRTKHWTNLDMNNPIDRDYYDMTVDELIEATNYSDSQSWYSWHKWSYKRKWNKVYWKWYKWSDLDDVSVIDDIYNQEWYDSLDHIYNNSSDYYDKWLKKRKKRK